jgi:hypothetical protein
VFCGNPPRFGNNEIGDVGVTALAAALAHLPQLQTLRCVAYCQHAVVLVALCSSASRGPLLTRVGLWQWGSGCRFFSNEVGDAGAAALAGALIHCSLLQTLEYVCAPEAPKCTLNMVGGVGLGTEPAFSAAVAWWHVRVCMRGGRAVRCVVMQPSGQHGRRRRCGCGSGGPCPRAPTADAAVRSVDRGLWCDWG